MKFHRAASIIAAGLLVAGAAHATSPYDAAVEADSPLAYFNLVNSTATQTTSAVNGYTLSLVGGATVQAGAGPDINSASVPGLVLANTPPAGEYATAGGSAPLDGDVSTSGTIVAWINLASLASTDGRIFSIAGESAVGDDLDLQIDPSDHLDFFTNGGGAAISSTTLSTTGDWVFVAGTFTSGGDADVYINGVLTGTAGAGSRSDNGSPFYIGQSSVFGGRNFDGSIADVAVFNTQLTADQIQALYSAASLPAVSEAPEPGSWALMLFGVAFAGAALRFRHQTLSLA